MSARSEAKARGDLKYIPETPCKNGHVSPLEQSNNKAT